MLVPVVTEPKKAAGALNWAVSEMMRRYDLFKNTGVRKLESYNTLRYITGGEKIPQLVVIIDELADLMMVAAKEVEDYVCRLAQLARAAGIHLIIATQRPSVDVITGLIKANICLLYTSRFPSKKSESNGKLPEYCFKLYCNAFLENAQQYAMVSSSLWVQVNELTTFGDISTTSPSSNFLLVLSMLCMALE